MEQSFTTDIENIKNGAQIAFQKLIDFSEKCTPALFYQQKDVPQKKYNGKSLQQVSRKGQIVFERISNLPLFNIHLIHLSKLLVSKHLQSQSIQETLTPYYTPQGQSDATLVFESRFEWGNLSYAIRVAPDQYNWILQNDLNSKGNTQWFFFQVQNTRAYKTVKFDIINFGKSESLYNDGMSVMVYSVKQNEKNEIGWVRDGYDISYYANGILRDPKGSKKRTYHTLSFSYTFQHNEDSVYFAYSVPYTYTKLWNFLHQLEMAQMECFKIDLLAHTLAGNKWYILDITANGTAEELKQRRGVVISARVHPGESTSQWVMHGLLNFLTSEHHTAVQLRNYYVFKIIPMLNPDGVINGNYRTNLSGEDLNRRWKNPVEVLHPTICAARKAIFTFSAHHELEFIIDLHGHSRKNNSFAYGCNVKGDKFSHILFPYILSKITDVFKFRDWRFNIHRSKEDTQRVALFKSLNWKATYTIENSFGGISATGYQFTTDDYQKLGQDICRSMLEYFKQKHPEDVRASLRRSGSLPRNGFLPGELAEAAAALASSAHSNQGSDSDPSEDELDLDLQMKIKPRGKRHAPPKSRLQSAYKRRIKSSSIKKRKSLLRSTSIGPRKPEIPQSPKRDAPPPQRHKLRVPKNIGERTYYNKAGILVHDQISQTPRVFYQKKREIAQLVFQKFNESLQEQAFSKSTTCKSSRSGVGNSKIFSTPVSSLRRSHMRSFNL